MPRRFDVDTACTPRLAQTLPDAGAVPRMLNATTIRVLPVKAGILLRWKRVGTKPRGCSHAANRKRPSPVRLVRREPPPTAGFMPGRTKAAPL